MGEVELVVDAGAEVGEGPLWHGGSLWWLDIPAGEVHRLDPASGDHEASALVQPVGAIAPRAAGGFVVAARDGFGIWHGPGSELDLVVAVEHEETANRMNDGKCDPDGRFWASTMETSGAEGAGTLYRLDPDLTVTPHLNGLAIGNGLAWSGDGSRMYFIDSLSGGIDVLDFDRTAGVVSDRRRFVTVAEGEGLPDGMTIDAEGCLWVAFFGGGCVRRYTDAGVLDTVLGLPVDNVTSCTFGGPDLDELYITTAWHGLDAAERAAQPLAGGLFRARVGVGGAPAVPFGG